MYIPIHELSAAFQPIRAAVLDFDGTISTLRCGWEAVMEQVFLRNLSPSGIPQEELTALIRAYIDESTGIQTIYQMEWLASQVKTLCRTEPLDPWFYKDEYNKALLEMVNNRIRLLEQGTDPSIFLIPGSVEFLHLLQKKGVSIYIASGTDDVDLQHEAALLGISGFAAHIQGAPHRQKNCSKEAVLRSLVKGGDYDQHELMVLGDGKVEIMLGKELGAQTIGLATQETCPDGSINPRKKQKLEHAGADFIVPDFRPLIEALST